ncbi:aminotransferase class V-fold PLP-dependent enzyme [Tunicatimonas pelagia]|uniref:aminotransferase class V-fold PLP-dependent enzyme n=1 Tax=Tunicatimonas pelagia TaxID=931531 RepID=UPI00266605E0|nr:aminotransferase class V-fold PLP-dependent enzyme [Tunicatimonas pelagia]WKN46135.1 aminotransferase class V-fold PLP-dependent enzyme [Tunicatimonas pelagia]
MQSATTTIANQKSLFSLPPDITYLNCSYMAPLLKSVEEAGIEGLRKKQLPTQYGHYEFFHEVDHVRKQFSQLVNNADYQRVAILPSVSYGMAIIAKNLSVQRGDNIVVAGEQFPSNVYPWRKLVAKAGAELRTVAAPTNFERRGQRWNEHLLESIDNQTCMVAVAHTHWADGTRFDLKAIRQRTRDVGALLVVDGTQSVGAMPFDVVDIQPDALICAGYKCLMGPYGVTLAYFSEYFDGGEPLEEGWVTRHKSEDFTNLVNYQDQYQPKAIRYDMGERSNFILIPMMGKALEQVLEWQPERIQEYCHSISATAIEKIRKLGFWIEEETYRGHHLFGIRIPGEISLERLQNTLEQAKIVVSVRGRSMRVSPNMYNGEDDLSRLVDCLQGLK